MAARKTTKKATTTKVENVETKPVEVEVAGEAVLVFQAKKPLTIRAFKATAEMLRSEQEATGVKIVLKPFSAELEE